MVAQGTHECCNFRRYAPTPWSPENSMTAGNGGIAVQLDEIVRTVQHMLHGKFRSEFEQDAAIISTIRQTSCLSELDVALLICSIRSITASLQKYEKAWKSKGGHASP